MSAKEGANWASIAAGIPMIGMLGAYLSGAIKAPKTIEEHKSEAEKWERQASIAQRALLDQAVALSGVSMQLADAIEKARLEKLRTDKETRDLQTEIERLRKELAAAKAAPPTTPSTEGAP
jgi:predicted RNase H-like nuclease (RuvC/YqgF family)